MRTQVLTEWSPRDPRRLRPLSGPARPREARRDPPRPRGRPQPRMAAAARPLAASRVLQRERRCSSFHLLHLHRSAHLTIASASQVCMSRWKKYYNEQNEAFWYDRTSRVSTWDEPSSQESPPQPPPARATRPTGAAPRDLGGALPSGTLTHVACRSPTHARLTLVLFARVPLPPRFA